MIFSKFDFPLPTREEIRTVKWMADSCPEFMDGRELWILREFVEVFE